MNEINIKVSIEELKIELYNIIFLFQSGHDNSAALKVPYVTQRLLGILSSIKANNLEEALNIDYNKLNTILINVIKAIKMQNYILTDDLFEYELIPMIDTWNSKIQNITSEVTSDGK
ncbi:MAG: hypothetical protein PHX70_02255 [Clostridium sp.]|nr:hypothetical protein [Clostridium sp.]